jgi:hypothetical protein
MKLKKLTKSKQFFMQLQILKLYSKKKTINSKTTLRSTEILLNKIANVIYRFHIAGKKILFLGFPNHFSNTLKHTKHLFIPNFMWFNGMLTNKASNAQYKKTTKIPKNLFKLLLKLKEKPSLIIVYNLNDNLAAVKESYLRHIPVITFNNKLDILDIKSVYKSTGSYNFLIEKIKNNNFVFSFIKTIIYQGKRKKKVRKYENSNLSLFLTRNFKPNSK